MKSPGVTFSVLLVQDVERQAAVARNAKRMTAPKTFPRVAMDLATTVERIQQNFTISDPSLPDCPIVFASDSFLELTGYPRHEVTPAHPYAFSSWQQHVRSCILPTVKPDRQAVCFGTPLMAAP